MKLFPNNSFAFCPCLWVYRISEAVWHTWQATAKWHTEHVLTKSHKFVVKFAISSQNCSECTFFTKQLLHTEQCRNVWESKTMTHIFYQTSHYDDVIIGAMASQITSFTIVYSTVYSDADQRKHQSSASLAFVRGIHRRPVNSQHKWPVTRKMFPFHDVIMFFAAKSWASFDMW